MSNAHLCRTNPYNQGSNFHHKIWLSPIPQWSTLKPPQNGLIQTSASDVGPLSASQIANIIVATVARCLTSNVPRKRCHCHTSESPRKLGSVMDVIRS